MTKFNTSIFSALLLVSAIVLASCGSDDDEPVVIPERPQNVEARFTDTIRYEKEKTTAYNFEYPSTDPYGEPVTLSGTITIGDEVRSTQHARGLLLYNHYTVYRADQCPSKGELGAQLFMTGSGLITVSADYYGFGATEDKQQAYCISGANAQASVDALIAAKALLASHGYHSDDVLFNAGYSQGAQTAMAVVRLVAQKYPDIHLTCTFAGGGSYDIPETYRQFIRSGKTAMPSTVISVLLAYNEYFSLGMPREAIFREPLLSHIDEWVLSKKYSREQIDRLVASNSISDWCAPELLDTDSELSQRLMAALDRDNLCHGWSPRKDEHIYLFHNSADGAVPVENTQNLGKFLSEQGVEYLSMRVANYGALFGQPAHETGAIFFVAEALLKVCDILDINIWIDYNRFIELL